MLMKTMSHSLFQGDRLYPLLAMDQGPLHLLMQVSSHLQLLLWVGQETFAQRGDGAIDFWQECSTIWPKKLQ